MKILNECDFLDEKAIKKIEESYKAKYVLETCLRNKSGGWANIPIAIFYQETPHPTGSNYFGIYINEDNQFMITDGISATIPIQALLIDDTVIYSHFRWDFRAFKGVFVDGGRDYFKRGGERMKEAREVKLKVIDGQILIVEDQ